MAASSKSPFPFPVLGNIALFGNEQDVRLAAVAQADFLNNLREWLAEPAQALMREQLGEVVGHSLNPLTIVVWDVLTTIGCYSIEDSEGTRLYNLISAPQGLLLQLDPERVRLWKDTWSQLAHPRRLGDRLRLFFNECNRTGVGLANHWYQAIKVNQNVPQRVPAPNQVTLVEDDEIDLTQLPESEVFSLLGIEVPQTHSYAPDDSTPVLYRVDADPEEVAPAEGKKHFRLKRLYELLDCTNIEVVYLPGTDLMIIIDDEGKLKNRPYNHLATQRWIKLVPEVKGLDFLAGPAIFMPRKLLK